MHGLDCLGPEGTLGELLVELRFSLDLLLLLAEVFPDLVSLEHGVLEPADRFSLPDMLCGFGLPLLREGGLGLVLRLLAGLFVLMGILVSEILEGVFLLEIVVVETHSIGLRAQHLAAVLGIFLRRLDLDKALEPVDGLLGTLNVIVREEGLGVLRLFGEETFGVFADHFDDFLAVRLDGALVGGDRSNFDVLVGLMVLLFLVHVLQILLLLLVLLD